MDDDRGDLTISLESGVANGTLLLNPDGSFTYTPSANFSGSDSFEYLVTDPDGESATATAVITVSDVNAPPVAADDLVVDVDRSATTAVDVLGNDSDQDGDELAVVAWDATSEQGGEVDCGIANVCRYTPPEDHLGPDTFSYSVGDGIDATTADVTLLVGMPRACDQTGRNLLGTEGQDVLCGTDLADTIDGNGGDDIIITFGGNDTILPGSGSAVVDAGGGQDTIILLGTPQADVVNLSDRFVDGVEIIDVEEVELDLQGGDDRAVVVPSATTAFVLVGGPGFDGLTYQEAAVDNVVDSGSTITADGVEPVAYTQFETVATEGLLFLGTPEAEDSPIFINSPAEGLRIDLLGGDDLITVVFGSLLGPVVVVDSGEDGTDTLAVIGTSTGESIEVSRARLLRGSEEVRYSDMEVVVVDGAGGDDTLVLDFGAVEVGAAATGVTFVLQGGAGTDLLTGETDLSCVIDRTSSPLTIDLDDGTVIEVADTLEGVDITCAGIRHVVSGASGYWMARASGGISAFGDVQDHGDVIGGGALVALENHPANIGVWAVESDGTVHAMGRVDHLGDVDHLSLARPLVSMSATNTGEGYYLVGEDGGVFAFGDAGYHGSLPGVLGPGVLPNEPIVGSVASPSGPGYWLVAADGGVFAFGEGAGYFGSVPQVLPPGQRLVRPVVGMAATASGRGYWMVASDGGIFAFGDAVYHGSVPQILGPGVLPNEPIVGIVASPTGGGYWIVARDGGVFAFGDAAFEGSLGGTGVTDVVAFAG